MKKLIVLAIIAILTVGGSTEAMAQGFFNRIKNSVVDKVVNKVGNVVDKALDKGVDKVSNSRSSENGNENADANETANSDGSAAQQGGKTTKNAVEMAYAKSNFVPCDEIFVDDDMANEQLGEWPSKWDLFEGVGEVVSVIHQKALNVRDRWTKFGVLMKNPKNYLSDVFTIEFDIYIPATDNHYHDGAWLQLDFQGQNDNLGTDPIMNLEIAMNGKKIELELEKQYGKINWRERNKYTRRHLDSRSDFIQQKSI